MNNLLYIGLHGFAGSGKDTVAKALRLMLSYKWDNFDEFKKVWEQEAFKMSYATFGYDTALEDGNTYCIAFADQLKHICAEMFGIPVEHFYYNKENGWLDITGTFEYVEKLPYDAKVITAEEFHYMKNSNEVPEKPMFMSLREILVYVGTYICQPFINKETFTNGVQNKIKMVSARNRTLQYVICTDVRFYHEILFIKNNHGINIDITRSSVKQLDNIAEHDLDDTEDFDFTLVNDGTYDELLHNLWDLVHENVIFDNFSIRLLSHDGTNNFLRKTADNVWQTCFEDDTLRVAYDNGCIAMIDPSGGPSLAVGDILYNDAGVSFGKISSIEFNDISGGHLIATI